LFAPDSGRILVAGQDTTIRSAREAVRHGIVLVPEERQRQGLFFNLTVRHNLMLPSRAASRALVINPKKERREATALVQAWRITAPGVDAAPDALSGGNQQKVVLAKWLATSPTVVLLDEPTKGVDVGAKFEIHEIIRRQAAGGAACLVASSDLPEVLALCNRIVVMREGEVQGELSGDEATEEAVMRLATHERSDFRDAS
jgi:ABC-type sugar transport system ATPase subunit